MLRESKLIRGNVAGLKILGDGELKHGLTIEADQVSASAREKIEKAGGTVTLREAPPRRPTAQALRRSGSSETGRSKGGQSESRGEETPRRRKRRPLNRADVRTANLVGWFRRFLNTVKIPELRRRILFTLAVIVIVRLGAAITTPGVNPGGLAGLVSTRSPTKRGRRRRGAVQSVQRRRAGELRDLLARHHALHQRVDHAAAADGGHSAAGPTGAGRWRPAEDHAVHAVCDGRALHFPGISARGFVPASGVVSHDAARHHGDDGASWEFRWWTDPGWSFRIITVLTLTAGTLFLMWLGDQITERGIGNGISLIITIGIVARLPAALAQAWKTFVPSAETGRVRSILRFSF